MSMQVNLTVTLLIAIGCGGCRQQQRAAQSSPSPIPWQTIQPPHRIDTAVNPVPQKREPVKTFSGTGVVVLVNSEEGWIELNHEDIPNVMPAMQMEWSVKDRSALTSVRPGDKVDFTIQDDNGTQVITRLVKR